LYTPQETYWINIDYPQFKGRLHLSYKEVNNNLVEYLEDSRSLVLKHIPKASAINEQVIANPGAKVFGIEYNIMGSGAASPYQFYITDSTDHFLRGALYFNVPPNNDSLSPIIDFIKEDINHLLSTFQWREL
jgi:gliding motility-associated lipoprotein GldD